MNLLALWKYKNKSLLFKIDKMQQTSTLEFVAKLDKKTQIGTQFKYDVMGAESSTSFVAEQLT